MTKKEDGAVLAAVREGFITPVLEYNPSEQMRLLKAKFWAAFKANPTVDSGDISPAFVEDVIGRSLQPYLKDPQFWLWFKERDTAGRYIEVAAEKAGELAMLYLDPSVPFNDNARVQLIKYVLEFSGRSPPSRKEIKWHDREIAEASEAQLDAIITKLAKKRRDLPPAD